MKLRTRFGIVIGSVVLLVSLGIGGSLLVSERNFLVRESGTRQEALVESLAQAVRESHLSQDDLMLFHYTLSLKLRDPALVCAYVARGGRVLAHTQREFSGTPLGRLPPLPADAKLLTRAVELPGPSVSALGERPPQADASGGWTVAAAFSQTTLHEEAEKALGQARRRILFATLAVLAAGLLIAWGLSTALTRPIRALSQATARIGEGNLDGASLLQGRQDELGQLARDLGEMARRLKELDELKKEFVSSVTHELKSPLSAIESYLDLMLHEGGKRAEAAGPEQSREILKWTEDLQYIKSNTSRLFRFISDLLDLARIEKAQFDLHTSPVRLELLAAEEVQLFSQAAQSNGVALSLWTQEETLPTAPADPDRIRQVLSNLLSNALKFTPEGGKVTVRVFPGQDCIFCSVEDTGIGIPEEALPRVFGRFEQVREAAVQARGPKGAGLGLAIAKAIVEAHGGRLVAKSKPGRGTTFTFSIPLYDTGRTTHAQAHASSGG